MELKHFWRSLDLTCEGEASSEDNDCDNSSSSSISQATMSSEEAQEQEALIESEKSKTRAEQRERNRLAQQRYRRNKRNELTLMRIKAVKYFEREVVLCSQLVRVSQEKNAALAEVQAQKQLIDEMTQRLKVSAQEYGELQTKFTVLVNAHCHLLQRSNAAALMNATKAAQDAQQSAQTSTAGATTHFA